jgi:hypothetical protein
MMLEEYCRRLKPTETGKEKPMKFNILNMKILVLIILVLAFYCSFAQIAEKYEVPADSVILQNKTFTSSNLPKGYRFDKELGLMLHNGIQGQVIHRNFVGGLYETRAVKTPGGDYLLMFPDGGHYGAAGKSGKKVNNMVAYRSKDNGKTWIGPTVAFDIDYNQHGFVPLIPKEKKRIYAFGTQPIWGMYEPDKPGLQENAPIGYRYSDDDGNTWSEVRIIRPVNDPDYRGMSVMRMCETDAGTWILGSHEGDWSYKPLMTRQYLLRSEDQGKTWTLLPGIRHGGWLAGCFNRMDEGRPVNLGDGKVFLMTRTPEGHLWGAWSEDDGKTWTYPKPTSLIHPDAPPMLFKLSDDKTLIAFHHNSSRMQTADLTVGSQHYDRAELWFSTSTDGGHTWSEPRFLLVTALKPAFNNPWRDYNVSYCDMFTDNGMIHLFMPHRWSRALHLVFSEKDLEKFVTGKELLKEK